MRARVLASMTATVTLPRLLVEEARALARGRFALAGAAVLAALLVLMGALVATSLDGLWSFALLAYGILPALLAGFCAAHVASLRATRFGQALYTAPVRAGQVLTARVLLGFALAAAYLLVTLPFLLLASLHIEVTGSVLRAILAGAGLLAFSVGFGTMLGVLLAGRSLVAPVVLSGGFVLLSFFAMTFTMGLLFAPVGADHLLLRILHASPHVLLADALGLFAEQTGFVAADPTRSLALFLVETLGCLGVAAWAYVRAQGPETWEAGPAARSTLAILAVALLLAPIAAADATYERLEGHQRAGRGWSTESFNATALLVERGAPAPAFGERLAGTQTDPLHIDRRNERDLLLLVLVPAGEPLLDVVLTLEPGPDLALDRTRAELGDVLAPERGDVDRRLFPTWPTGSWAVLRVPIELTPTDPLDLTGNSYSLRLDLTWRSADGEPRSAYVLAGLRGDVAWAHAQMMLAGAPFLILTTSAAILRRIRVG